MASAAGAEAQECYNAGDYQKAISHLQVARAEKPNWKQEHNMALAEFWLDEKGDSEALLRRLHAIMSEIEAGSGQDAGAASGDTGDAHVLQYNVAVLSFQLRRYATALRVLEGLAADTESMGDALVLRTTFLMLETLMHAHRGRPRHDSVLRAACDRCDELTALLTRPHGFNGARGGGAEADTAGDDAGDAPRKEAARAARAEYQFRLHLYRAKLELLRGRVKLSRKAIKSAFEVYSREFRADVDSDKGDSASAAAAAEHLSPALVRAGWWALATGSRNTAAQLLKANLEYLRDNHRKVLKLLDSSLSGGLDESVYLNNVGCVHYRLRRYGSASLCFLRALALQGAHRPGAPASTLRGAGMAAPAMGHAAGDARTRHAAHPQARIACEVALNAGLALLQRGHPVRALRCVHAALQGMSRCPTVWLRVADCCIAAHAALARVRASACSAATAAPASLGTGAAPAVAAAASAGPRRSEAGEVVSAYPAVAATSQDDGAPVLSALPGSFEAGGPRDAPHGSAWVAAAVGSGQHRRLLLPLRTAAGEPGLAVRHRGKRAAEAGGGSGSGSGSGGSGGAGGGGGGGAVRPSLQLAAQALRTGLMLLDEQRRVRRSPGSSAAGAGAAASANGTASAGSGGGGGGAKHRRGASDAGAAADASAADGVPDRAATAWCRSRAVALSRLAYVELCMGNAAGALAALDDLAQLLATGEAAQCIPAGLRASLVLTGACYRAEACCVLEAPGDAVAALEALTGTLKDAPGAERALLYVNLANAHVAAGRHQAAAQALQLAQRMSSSAPGVVRTKLLLNLRSKQHLSPLTIQGK